jgi:hypothetical protein
MDSEDLPAESAGVAKYIHSVQPGSISLFFGCRNESDYLYREAMQVFRGGAGSSSKHITHNTHTHTPKTLTNLEVAMSRITGTQSHTTCITIIDTIIHHILTNYTYCIRRLYMPHVSCPASQPRRSTSRTKYAPAERKSHASYYTKVHAYHMYHNNRHMYHNNRHNYTD